MLAIADTQVIDFVINSFSNYAATKTIKDHFSIVKKYKYKGHKVLPYDLFHLAYPPENQNTETIYLWECSLFIEELLEFFNIKFPIQAKQQKIKNYCSFLNITRDRLTEKSEGKFSDRKILIDRFFGLVGFVVFQQFAPNSNYPKNKDLEDLGYKCFFQITDTLWEEFGEIYKTGNLKQTKKPTLNVASYDLKQPTVHGLFAQFLHRNKPDFLTNYFVENAGYQFDIFKMYQDLVSKEECTFLWAADDVLLRLIKLTNFHSPKQKLRALKIKIKYRPPHEFSPDYYSEIIQASRFYEMFGFLALHITGIHHLDARENNKFNPKQVQEIGKICFTTFLDYLKTK